MSDTINRTLVMTDDWGSVTREGVTSPATGQEVQDFIKTQLQNKVGYYHIISVGNDNRLLGFADLDSFTDWENYIAEKKWQADSEEAATAPQVICYKDISKEIPKPYFSLSLISNLDNADNKYVSIDGEVVLPITMLCTYNEYNDKGELTTSPESTDAILYIEATTGASKKSKRLNVHIDAGGTQLELNVELKDLMPTDGTYTVKMYLEANNLGDSKVTSSSKTFVVVKTKIDVDLITDWYIPQTIRNDQLTLTFNCQGSGVKKVLYYRVTGAGDSSGMFTLEGSKNVGTGSHAPVYINKSNYDITAHGIHNIEYWMVLDGDDRFKTETKTAQIMVISENYNLDPYLILKDVAGSVETKPLYNNTSQKIMQYSIHAPNTMGGQLNEVDLIFEFINIQTKQVLFTSQAKIKPATNQTLIQSIQIPDLSDEDTVALQLVCKMANGTAIKQEIPYIYIANNEDYSPSKGALFVFNPKLRSNDEDSTTLHNIYNTATGKNVLVGNDSNRPEWSQNISFQDIDGWVEDPVEGRCLRLLGGQSLQIPYAPLNIEHFDSPNTTIEISFKVNNIVDENVPLISICNVSTNADNKTIYNGLELRASDGYFLNKLEKTVSNLNDNDIMFSEGDRVHLALRISREKKSTDQISAELRYDPNKEPHSIIAGSDKLFARLYINGSLNRVIELSEFDYDNVKFKPGYSSQDVTSVEMEPRYIKLGNTAVGADIDIYEIRVYQEASMKPEYDIMRDFVASLPTIEGKDEVIRRNDIRATDSDNNSVFRDTDISYDACVAHGINTMLWAPGTASKSSFTRPNGREFGDTKKTSNIYNVGNLTLKLFKTNEQTGERTLDNNKSGVFYNMTTEGQGTTAMLYFKWNQRYKFEDITTEDAGGNQVVHNVGFLSDADKDAADNAGDSTYTYKQYYKINDADPQIKRLDAKINWASSMQSHKMGSTALYNDLQKDIVGGHAMNFLTSQEAFDVLDLEKMGSTYKTSEDAWKAAKSFTGKEDGYGSCRTAVRQEPFAYFVQPTASDSPKFYGMLTFGASKGDKPTFGYNSKFNKHFIMFEGTDNFRNLITGHAPWDNIHYDQVFDDKGEVDGGILEIAYDSAGTVIKGDEQFEVSMGDGSQSAIGTKWNGSNPCLVMFKDMVNFIFLHNPNLQQYPGKYQDLVAKFNEESREGYTGEKTIDKTYFYYVVSNGSPATYGEPDVDTKKYDVFRYSHLERAWVPAGLTNSEWSTGNSNTQYYQSLNLLDQLGLNETSVSRFGAKEFRDARALKFKEGYSNMVGHKYGWDTMFPNGISDFMNVDDLRYTVSFIKLIAGTDNWSKNTYIYNPGLYFKKDTLTGGYGPYTLEGSDEIKYRGSAKYEGLSKFGFFQDDLDTIFEIDNYGAKTKPYYVEETDWSMGPEGIEYYWNSHNNALYSTLALAYPDQMRSTMSKILAAMQSKAGTPQDCFQKYYQDKAQHYFPEVIYNVTAEKLYMDGHYRGMSKLPDSAEELAPARHSLFLSQCLGGQTSAEKEWQKKRVIYLSSYAKFGAFAGGTDGSGISFQPAGNAKFTLIPHMWLYPWMTTGSTDKAYPGSFASSFDVPGRVPAGQEITFEISAQGEDSMVLKGSNYYKSLGNLARVSPLGGNFTITGQRLTDLQIKGTYNSPIWFNAYSSFKSTEGGADNLRTVEISGQVDSNHTNKIFDLNEIDLQHLWRLETVDLSATNTKKVILKEGSNIKKLILPGSINTLQLLSQTQLSNLNNITTESIGSNNNIFSTELNELEITNPNEYCMNIVKTLIKTRAESVNKQRFTALTLQNFVWTEMTIDVLKYIMTCLNLRLKGRIDIIQNKENVVDYDFKNQLLTKFGNVDDPNNELYITYEMKHLYNPDSVLIIGDSNIYQNGLYKFKLQYLAIGEEDANDFNEMIWSVSGGVGGVVFEMKDTKTGLVECSGLTESNLGGSITLNCLIKRKREDGEFEDLTAQKTIYLSQPDANVGDYLYADGTYGPPSDYTGLKSIVGVCFLVHRESDGRQRRVAVSLDMMTNVDALRLTGLTNASPVPKLISWGLSTSYITANQITVSSDIGGRYANTTKLGSEPVTVLRNHSQGNRAVGFYEIGSNGNGHMWAFSPVYAKVINAEKNQQFGLYQFMKQQTTTNYRRAADPLGDIGWQVLPSDGSTWQIVDKCAGRRNTDAIIQYRNAILKNETTIKPEQIETIDDLFGVLKALGSDELRSKLYPAASYCYAYEPTNLKNAQEYSNGYMPEILNDKLTRTNWFLPSFPELLRILTYIGVRHTNYMDDGVVAKNYLPAFQYYYDTYEFNMGKLASNNFASSTEQGNDSGESTTYCYLQMPGLSKNAANQDVSGARANLGSASKMATYNILPCVEF